MVAERNFPGFLSACEVDTDQHAPGRRRAERARRPAQEAAPHHVASAFHVRVFVAEAEAIGLHLGLVLVEVRRHQLDHGGDRVDRHDGDLAVGVEGKAAPVRAADVGRSRQRSALGRRREDALVPQVLDHALAGHSIGRVEVPEVLQREALRAQLDGAERLCLRCAFTRDVAGWHVALFDGEQRFAGVSMQHEQHAGLRRLQDRGHVLAAAPDRGEGGGRRIVVVPEVVMDGLEMPGDLAGRSLERDDRVRVAVVARPQAAEVVRPRARSRREDEAALRVGHHD